MKKPSKVLLGALIVLFIISSSTLSLFADYSEYRFCGRCGQNVLHNVHPITGVDATGHWTMYQYSCWVCSRVTYSSKTYTPHQWTTRSQYYKTADNSGHILYIWKNCSICGRNEETHGNWEAHVDANHDGICDKHCI